MCKDKENSQKNPSDALVFLNTPINNTSEDIIGFTTHVNSLRSAIENGAQLIAVTSPFGAGKSSVAELLRSSLKDENAKLVNISMWSHLCGGTPEDDTLNLHRSFLYQLVSKIDPKRGEFINRKLSPNYGLLKLHTKNGSYSFLTFLSIVFFILGYIFPKIFEIGLPVFVGFGSPDLWNNLFVFVSIICISMVIIHAEIIFSSKNSEGKRTIGTNDIFELYQKFVCEELKENNSSLRKKAYKFQQKFKLNGLLKINEPFEKYIAVIEDLDRSNNHASVIAFLKELRKYYIQDINESSCNKPNIIFIVNVKPEASLYSNASSHKNKEHESLYAKIFDYVLNIQTINIADYETVLESILSSKKDIIKSRLDYTGDKLVKIPGMQWIIRGDNLGIRDIKDRLNKAFNLYDSLIYRFSGSDISFEKCAVVAYLTTAFEKDFISTKDNAFGILVEASLQGNLTYDLCTKELKSDDESFINAVIGLIQAKHIDSNYRIYFYNYPKDSIVYTHEELVVQNAILHDELSDELHSIACRVAESDSEIIHATIDRVKSLKLPLPSTVYKTEPLFIEALHSFPEYIYNWARTLDYSENSFEKTSQQFLQILKYDNDRSVYSSKHISTFCNIWEEKFTEKQLLKFRKMLCEFFPHEILLFTPLFSGVHNLISIDEMDKLDLQNAINLISVEKELFCIDYVTYVVNRFENEFDRNNFHCVNQVEDYLTKSSRILPKLAISAELLRYMKIINTIVPEYEAIIVSLLRNPDLEIKYKHNLFSSYQNIINETTDKGLSVHTLENISLLKLYKGFSLDVAKILFQEKFTFDGLVIALLNNESIPFNDSSIVTSIKENIEWLLSSAETFDLIRISVLNTRNASTIRSYDFLFSENCRVVNSQEFGELEAIDDVKLVLETIPPVLVTDTEAHMLSNYFSRKFRRNQTAVKILLFISEFDERVAASCFKSLNFDNAIKYRTFSDGNKTSVKTAFSSILHLDSVEGKIEFIEITRFADSGFELSMSDEIEEDTQLQESYANALNKCDISSITDTSIELLYSFDSIYPLNDKITELMFQSEKYTYYVSSKTRYNKCFVMEQGDRFDILWPTYLKILSSTNFRTTSSYMAKNMEFINFVISKGAYKDFPEEKRMLLCNAMQDEASLRDVVCYDNSFALNYLSHIGGFYDDVAAKAFLDLVESNDYLLLSEELYNHTYEMLVSGTLKGRYTRMRNKILQ